ncbi:thioredoxin domain-containing protein [Kytococcus sedentarius]|uniref:Protein-disulfide isomerase n=1 Tax=Kytococcus sedentarius (strain ATCC 14392 / DSM 20547 / JCM 11482 / CCUG 33030 / NBRC 15357 / NCTC 11040 / CCM 314 / 541) TaxID=478801 RepID=C7NHG6_KYTSD|nr:thioredoxin domain-containing protein [Kytococcus sedentarius]ACV06323.1 protein-disulfide isomerase [Kytococcus sedentarius DSM 20547]OLT26209.1 hypothetical protein BJF82_03860 [Kytococcus sp. CUA-901]QQB64653.1 thioredoxin domain-containing protein [Kytococcus sedentarius]STX12259.1 Serine/threonine-protein kinase pknE [Kytococcus sedentarius]
MPVDNSPRPSGAHRPAGSSGGGVSKALIALIAALVVGALVVLGIWLLGQGDDDDSTAAPSSSTNSQSGSGDPSSGTPADMAVPQGMPEKPAGVTVGEAGGPELIIFEDFQCPACKSFEDLLGDDIATMIDDGKAQVTYFPKTFLDGNLGTDHSERAASAAFCASDGGKFREYHDALFANHPEREGDGWTDEQLKGFGKDAGLEGDALATFEKCVADGTYREYAKASEARSSEMGVMSTPTVYLNGQRMELTNAEDFRKQVDEAGAPQKSDASPSAS